MNNTRFIWDNEMDETKFAKWHNNEGILYPTEKSIKANAADNLLTTVEDYSKFMVYILNGADISKKLQTDMIKNQLK